MRRGILAGFLGLFLVWFLVAGLAYLLKSRPAIWATPTSEPYDVGQLTPIAVPGHGRICVDGMPWAPEARFVQLRVLPGPKGRTPAIGVEATGPGGYRAEAEIPAGLLQNARATAPIRPAGKQITGTLCVTNEGTRPTSFYGVPTADRLGAPVKVTLNGSAVADRQLSVTLLQSGDKSILGRLGTVLSHVAAFRPVGAWMVWILLALLLVGAPVGVALALARASAEDDEAATAAPAPGGTTPPSPPPSAPS
jgi:GAF domain-containing protein